MDLLKHSQIFYFPIFLNPCGHVFGTHNPPVAMIQHMSDTAWITLINKSKGTTKISNPKNFENFYDFSEIGDDRVLILATRDGQLPISHCFRKIARVHLNPIRTASVVNLDGIGNNSVGWMLHIILHGMLPNLARATRKWPTKRNRTTFDILTGRIVTHSRCAGWLLARDAEFSLLTYAIYYRGCKRRHRPLEA